MMNFHAPYNKTKKALTSVASFSNDKNNSYPGKLWWNITAVITVTVLVGGGTQYWTND